ncbi:MAG: chemotaxis protein CheD [Methanomicrobiales archaeon]|nr:chemotaxis protein CheD [Methanomicrobiales archaeon]
MIRTLTGRNTDVIGIGEYRISSTPMATIGLGSCIGLIIHDRDHGYGGLAHIMLPASNGRKDRPGKYADTAIGTLAEDLRVQGSSKNALAAKLVGGASMFPGFNGSLNIGERNIETVRAALAAERIRIAAEDVGGNVGRSVIYDPGEMGKISIRRADGTCTDM